MSESGGARLARRSGALLLLAIAVYYAVWGGEYSAFDLRRLTLQKGELASRLSTTELQVDSLRDLAQRLESDAATIEAVARERFGMIREGETLYRFVPLPHEAPLPPPQAAPAPEPARSRLSARTR